MKEINYMISSRVDSSEDFFRDDFEKKNFFLFFFFRLAPGLLSTARLSDHSTGGDRGW